MNLRKLQTSIANKSKLINSKDASPESSEKNSKDISPRFGNKLRLKKATTRNFQSKLLLDKSHSATKPSKRVQ